MPFDMLGPVVPKCRTLIGFDYGNSEHSACLTDAFTRPDCVMIRIGWSAPYADAVFDRTACRLEVFDCYSDTVVVPARVASRVRVHRLCLRSAKHVSGDAARKFVDWGAALTLLKLQDGPPVVHLAFDLEVLRGESARDG